MADHPWHPKDTYPTWILPFLLGVLVGALAHWGLTM